MRVVLRLLKWVGLSILTLLIGGFLFALFRFGPVPLTLAWAKDTPNGPKATPAITLPFDREAAWETLQAEVYGRLPETATVRVVSRNVHDHLGGTLTNLEMVATLDGTDTQPFGISLVSRHADAPLIVWQSFSPRGAAIDHPSVPGERFEGTAANILEFVFGRYIQTPPVEAILDQGYAFAVMHPPEMIPDNGEAGVAELSRMSPGEPRMGAILAWALSGKMAVDALQMDALETKRPIISAGHSRYGKSALVWAAIDPRVEAVISHQGGTGGASLSKDKRGETVEQITYSYPHWFASNYAEENLSVDQHHLLALIAPRPVLLGGARRDVWSDPNGALRAAIGAVPAYEEAGVTEPLPARDLSDFVPSATIALWLRPGTHGVVEEDWPAFLRFLDAHFQSGDDEPLRTAG